MNKDKGTPPPWLKFSTLFEEEKQQEEQVLVFPAPLVSALEFRNNFCSNTDFLSVIIEMSEFRYRNEVESDESVLQLIPYSVLQSGKEILVYNRGNSTEERLSNKVSVGIGGHINPIDAAVSIKLAPQYAALREIFEETGFFVPYITEFYGFIIDTSESVGRVHLGALFLYEVYNGNKVPFDQSALLLARLKRY